MTDVIFTLRVGAEKSNRDLVNFPEEAIATLLPFSRVSISYLYVFYRRPSPTSIADPRQLKTGPALGQYSWYRGGNDRAANEYSQHIDRATLLSGLS